MFTAAAPAALTDRTDPDQDRQGLCANPPNRFFSVLVVVRALIDFGRQMLGTVQQGSNAGAALAGIKLRFRTLNIAVILARITQALALATALETRLEKLASRAPKGPSHPKPRVQKPKAANDDLPSAAEITKRLRQRPIAAVLADICRDLEIAPSDPLWRDLVFPFLENGGNPARLAMDAFDRNTEAFPELYADPDVRALLEENYARHLPPSGADPPR